MIYAESNNASEKGLFYSIGEFLPYRSKGWIAAPQYNEKADAKLVQLQTMSDASLKYLAPMIRTGEDARFELHRRQEENEQKEPK